MIVSVQSIVGSTGCRISADRPASTSIAAGFLGLVLAASSAPAGAGMTVDEMLELDRGFAIFMEEEFEGNGRTCGTCHIPEEQYNIFPSDIERLRGEELEKVLASNVPGLENEAAVRARGLFNVGEEEGDARECDGNHECEGPIFRSSMTVGPLALTKLFPNDTFNPEGFEMLGWSGQGSPRDGFHHGNADDDADGTVRAFANGAIAQHLPLSLERIAKGTACPGAGGPDDHCDEHYDFRFATDEESDALEAFQNWLGRREQFEIGPLVFHDPRAENGKRLYMSNEASCNTCHVNGGANFSPNNTGLGANIFQHSDVDLERFRLSELIDVFIPEDHGFIFPGQNPAAFNGQPVIEAARKEGFFHNHAVLTVNGSGGDDPEFEGDGGIEGAITFYFREPFISSEIHVALQGLLDGGGGDGSGNLHIDRLEDFLAFGGRHAIEEMGAFIRALSAYYGIRDCERLVQETIDRIDASVPHDLPASHCGFNLEDVQDVLREAKVRPRPYAKVYRGAYELGLYLDRAAERADRAALRKILKRLEHLRRRIAANPEIDGEARTSDSPGT